jgi:integrase
MKANAALSTVPANIVTLPTPRLGRIPKAANATGHRQRFRILNFANATGSTSYRVQGMGRDGKYVRQNFASLHDAQLRQIELEADFHSRQPDASAIRATKLSENQLRIAEAAFLRLDNDDQLLAAVNFFMEKGRPQARLESLRLDDAVAQFIAWVDGDGCPLREQSRHGLRIRVGIFGNSLSNLRVDAITPETIEGFLDGLKVAPVTKDNYRRAVSRFFTWCIARPRRWTAANPCREVRVERLRDTAPPQVLTVAECEALLRSAETYKRGLLVPYVAVCIFAGLRPFEAARLTWAQVNLADGEIRLEAIQTKTKRSRVVSVGTTLKAWLEAYQGKAFFPVNWRRHFDAVKDAAGFSSRDGNGAKQWEPDILRHTAISHFFRECGSYGRTAEAFGNSEAIIKQHYQGRVSSEETKAFYGILPMNRKGQSK